MSEIELRREQAALMPIPLANTGAARIREAADVMMLCKQLADAVCNTGMMPKHLRGKPEETAAVMLYGATLDLDPMQSVRSIYEVHGQPGLYARAMVALVMGRGHEVWTVETSDESVTVAGQRRGSMNVEASTWTIERATKAGYVPTVDAKTGDLVRNEWGKVIGNEKYLTDPQSMLYAKAASEVCRKIAPDVLAGVYAVEELQSEWRDSEVVSVQRSHPERPAGLAALVTVAAPTETPEDEAGSAAASPSGQTSGAEVPPVNPGPETAGAVTVEEDHSSAPEPQTGGVTSAQLKKIGVTMKELGITQRADALTYVNDLLPEGREVTSRNELTKAEAHRLIEALEYDLQNPFGGREEPADRGEGQ